MLLRTSSIDLLKKKKNGRRNSHFHCQTLILYPKSGDLSFSSYMLHTTAVVQAVQGRGYTMYRSPNHQYIMGGSVEIPVIQSDIASAFHWSFILSCKNQGFKYCCEDLLTTHLQMYPLRPLASPTAGPSAHESWRRVR